MWFPIAHLVLAIALSNATTDLEAGRALRQQGKIDEAIAFFQKSLAAEPASPEALRELGHSFALAGRYPEAIETYGQLASQNLRWQLEGAKWTGLTHLYLGNVEASLDQSRLEERLAAQLGESSAAARAARQIGYVYTELAQFASANTAYVTALNRDPNDIDTLYFVGILAARQGDWGSLRYQVLDLEPLVAYSHNPDRTGLVDHLKAELAVSRGDEEEALELLDGTGSANATLYLATRARAYDHQGDLAKAEATYRSILDSTDDRLEFPLVYVKALLGMAEVLDAQGRQEEAASTYRRFLEHWGNAAGPLPGVVDARSRLELLERRP
jgi:superkiller protein 3